ncbi:MAG TPA: DUF302 domain-containing protein [Thermoanaerobaculia bacterium]|jgi:uncharacterized protein (DUF302 family)|nr:DUF302 domain-containing protein [Thermoanaerobaculia bacterium]MDI9631897.1 DUF302 domain-containing protein [Acidobacteriota bacterium]OQC42025.1 MAG: hypothetical protein BWX64_00491 [Acidobacteria bacterium ADurb.Bin051]MBP7813812.1 DUF302 domain-containing protein [Thermoanaerobaculia bacterium]MBP8844540.1 DUF302 domain-containing protein [Thermoanaerobaculia bacterium]
MVRETAVAFEATSSLGFAETVARAREALQQEGFGVVAEIDLQAKLREKLGVEVEPNLILGACHPPSALRAVQAVPEVSVLLPCNLCVAVEQGRTVVRAMNPASVMEKLANPALAPVGSEIGAALKRVVAAITG